MTPTRIPDDRTNSFQGEGCQAPAECERNLAAFRRYTAMWAGCAMFNGAVLLLHILLTACGWWP